MKLSKKLLIFVVFSLFQCVTLADDIFDDGIFDDDSEDIFVSSTTRKPRIRPATTRRPPPTTTLATDSEEKVDQVNSEIFLF